VTDFYSAGRRRPDPSLPHRLSTERRLTGPARRRWPRRLLVGLNIVVAVCLIGAVSAYGYVQWRLDQIHRENIAGLTAINGGKPFTLLLVGSDSRAALAKNADNQQFGGTAGAAGQRSDTIILARIAPEARQIMLLSIPRDLWVNIPGMGMSRINSAFDNGASLLVQTIQTDLGIPVNHYVEVNFDTFRDITAAVGGVSFYFPTPAKDAFSLLNVTQPGCVALSGDQALGFVRSRHYEYYQNGSWHFEAESDLARIKRQQTFIRKMIKKAESKFTDIGALNGVIGGITKNLTVDSGFSNTLLLNLAKDFHGIDPSSLATVTLPNYGYTTAGGADVLGLQQPQAAQTIAAFNTFGNNLPAASGHSKSSNTTTPKTVPAVKPPKTTVAPSKISVEVANGDGVVGQAAAMNTFLTGRGFRVQTNVISPIHGLAVTQVRYAPDSKSDAEQVASLIPGGATLTSDSNLTLSPYNVEVVTGSSYTAASGGPPASSGSSSSSSTASTAPTTTIPGTNSGTYVLPGMPAGATPPSC
jgi:polyisoprenyl-teichoic acid--peptidoglycan teichoic acid transferase